jgi:uncharacterized protein (DUF924 family)
MTPGDILDFWFGAPGSPVRGTQRPEWFRKDAAFDALIGRRFGAAIEAALRNELQGWNARMPDALAELLLLDQFTRNVFRGTPRAFAGDPRALAAARAIVARGDDRALPPVQRQFVYLPFEHAEDMDAQREGIALYDRLAHEHPPMADALDWARRHAGVIERFGRFPHRNAILDRASTPAELEYLRQPGAGF